MNSWIDRKARQKAKVAFWTKLTDPANNTLREKCIKYPTLARIEFAADWFYLEEQKRPAEHEKLVPIPLDVEFRIFEDDVPSREKLVTLILREELDEESNEPTDDHQVWLCTWWPYEKRKDRKDARKAKK